jgi:hypothetical protein
VSFFALATRDDGVLFTSFVNAVVVATIYAQEQGVQDVRGMPTASIFGNKFSWTLR